MRRSNPAMTHLVTVPVLLLAALATFASPASSQEKQERMEYGASALPVIGTPEQSRDWMSGMSLPQFMNELFVEAPGEAGEYRCNIAVINQDGEVRGSGQSLRPVEVEEGMPLSETCRSAFEMAYGSAGGELLPGDMLVNVDAMLLEPVPVTSEMLFAGEIDGLFVMDEVMAVASRSRDPYVAELGQRGMEGDTPGMVFLIMFTPAEEGEEFTTLARAVILPDTRPF